MKNICVFLFLILVCNSCIIFKSNKQRLSEKYLAKYGNVFVYTFPFSNGFNLWSYQNNVLIFSSSFDGLRNRKIALDSIKEAEIINQWIVLSDTLEKNNCAVLDDDLLEVKIKQDNILTERTIYVSCITEYQDDIDKNLLNHIKLLVDNNLIFSNTLGNSVQNFE